MAPKHFLPRLNFHQSLADTHKTSSDNTSADATVRLPNSAQLDEQVWLGKDHFPTNCAIATKLLGGLTLNMATMVDVRSDEPIIASSDRSLKRGHEEVTTPTTPRAPNQQNFQSMGAGEGATVRDDEASVKESRTQDGHQPDVAAHEPEPSMLYRDSSQNSIQSSAAVEDIDMDNSDEDQDGSDNDTENGDPGRSSKKKKGQRFFCTEFPPCNLSFTRSEHLARHIRKHTGERPFQCHCNRRFSRLDNLRQHAQTVHVNEEIPGDSLAATGTRFQRQIRTDRVRPTGGRPRSGTAGSSGSHSRGHSRNLSASSVGSNASSYSNPAEQRRRPPPLMMANDGSTRSQLGIEPPSTPPPGYRGYSAHSPGGFSTPTSATYSGAPGSPSYGSTMDSPISNTSRGMFFGPRTPDRRLSVPSGTSPFQSPANIYPQSYPSPQGHQQIMYSNQSSVYASPTASQFGLVRMDGNVLPADDVRRRTWHASTHTAAGFNYSRPATSGLTYSQTPDAPHPAYAQYATAAANQAPRLPGIESFDQVQHRPSTPPRRNASPSRIDPALQAAPVFATPAPPTRGARSHGHTRSQHSLDMSKLDIQGSDPKHLVTWAQQTMTELHNISGPQPSQSVNGQTTSATPPIAIPQQPPLGTTGQPLTPQRSKRHGWYAGPVNATRTSPEDSSSSEGVPTPGTSVTEVHPAIMHSNGYIEPQHAVIIPEGPGNVSPPVDRLGKRLC